MDEQARQADGILTINGRRISLQQMVERAKKRERAMGFKAVGTPRENPERAREMLRRAMAPEPGRYL